MRNRLAAGVDLDPRQTCGTLQVPLDYRRPGGRQITVAVSRIPAADPATRRGVLLLNPGGPGGEGLDTPSEAGPAGEPLLAAYDLIGCDPRGVGHSTPVTCGLTEAQLTPPLPYPAPDGSIAANVAFADPPRPPALPGPEICSPTSPPRTPPATWIGSARPSAHRDCPTTATPTARA
jgi:pimeloyl-ACP methyl ester carboxylesterase